MDGDPFYCISYPVLKCIENKTHTVCYLLLLIAGISMYKWDSCYLKSVSGGILSVGIYKFGLEKFPFEFILSNYKCKT